MASDTNVPNIYIIGPQSTGKTTIIKKLQSELDHWPADPSVGDPHIISEVARSVLTKHNFSAEDITSSPNRCIALQKLILEAQASAENEALQSSSWFISDRSGFDPLVYAKRYVSADAVASMQMELAWAQVKVRMANSIIVVCEAGTPWLTDDGVRLMPASDKEWMEVFQDFCGLLQETELDYL
ncbi:hypothetical protein ACLX1H_008044 [Fusarium chlamydosporum]